ncbi:hypothetical protein [Aerococcus viridans]
MGENCCISKRVKRMVMDLTTESLTLKHMAESCNISDHTVQRVIDGVDDDLKPSIFNPLPGHIAFDEFKGVKNTEGKYYCWHKNRQHILFKKKITGNYFLQWRVHMKQENNQNHDLFEDKISTQLKAEQEKYAVDKKKEKKTNKITIIMSIIIGVSVILGLVRILMDVL